MCPCILGWPVSIPDNPNNSGFLATSSEDQDEFTKPEFLSLFPGLKGCGSSETRALVTSLSLYSCPHNSDHPSPCFYNQRQGRSQTQFPGSGSRTHTSHSMRNGGNGFGREHSPLKNPCFRQFILAVSAEASIRMCGGVHTAVALDTILDNRGSPANGGDCYFLEPLSDYSIMFLVNGGANGCKNLMIYLEGSLGNAEMQVHNFEIDVIELFLNAHENVLSGSSFANLLFCTTY